MSKMKLLLNEDSARNEANDLSEATTLNDSTSLTNATALIEDYDFYEGMLWKILLS